MASKQGGLFDESANRDTAANAYVEPHTSDAPLGAQEAPRFDAPCRITFHHIRGRLADMDGISVKACIDGLVHGNVFADDSPEQVAEIHHRQTKGKPETTIIEIEEIEPGEPHANDQRI